MATMTLDLPTDVRLALRNAATDLGLDRDQAAVKVLREGLIAGGWLELEHDLDEDTETKGSA